MNSKPELEKTYDIDIVSQMESMLANELSKSINDDILLECLTPETKGLPSEERWKIYRTQQIRENKIDDILNENSKL
jgi:hypothetical protein